MSTFTWPWLVSTIIAVLAFFLALKSYRRRYAEDVRASVSLSSRPYKVAWTIKSQDDPSKTLYLVTEWECVLINVGDRPVNITGWGTMDPARDSVVPLPKIYKIKTAQDREYTGKIIEVHKNVYFVEPDEEIPWPLDVSPGTSKAFKIKLGLPIDQTCQELVQAELNAQRIGDNTQEIFQFLGGKGLTISGAGIIPLPVPLYFQSATGSRFVDFASLYFRKIS